MGRQRPRFISEFSPDIPAEHAELAAIIFAAERSAETPEVDLHGLDVHDALHEIDLFIDRAFIRGDRGVKIIHGAGTGILRKAVREHLKSHEHIQTSVPASGAESSGVTIAILEHNGDVRLK
ncbi:hypothetical protein COV06_03070 [Candidatus Uhrbacteria bacterium CG10_big_fil_rev_8_21_14_0_10_50_16]|uniref:Smr domain-containing protein n=1 Tax=Candidatus Uhrbacteria bacterium CG10_big_fil_rev_8_21_14_0_10_50_16 TaxID=1975039 RepID=A0A2H0RLW1_9BACT|nr:MAG: hypothetical protein COV06_03070 [Candidatus Uhrbacteria bacterium CG10_big_fil_rev_8_21_14_0_10_50_16]